MTTFQRSVLAVITSATIFSASTFVNPPSVNATSWDPAKTTVVYLQGTSDPLITGSKLQNDYQYIYRSLANKSRLNIPRGNHFVLNYTSKGWAAQTDQKPQVIQSSSPWRPNGAPASCPGKDASFMDAYIHAYQAAWRIQALPNSKNKILLIGHSQGGLIARIIQLVAAGDIPTEAQTGDEKIPPSCWPKGLKNRIIGVVTLGAPLDKDCSPFYTDFFEDARKWVTALNKKDAGRALVIGADPKERVGAPFADTIGLSCATNIYSKTVSRLAIYGGGTQPHEHTWYIEGGGKCPGSRLLRGPGDGRQSQYFCEFKKASNGIKSAFPTQWSLVLDKTNASQPGTIYDLIAIEVLRW